MIMLKDFFPFNEAGFLDLQVCSVHTPLNLSGDCTILDLRLSQSCLSPAKLAFISA